MMFSTSASVILTILFGITLIYCIVRILSKIHYSDKIIHFWHGLMALFMIIMVWQDSWSWYTLPSIYPMLIFLLGTIWFIALLSHRPKSWAHETNSPEEHSIHSNLKMLYHIFMMSSMVLMYLEMINPKLLFGDRAMDKMMNDMKHPGGGKNLPGIPGSTFDPGQKMPGMNMPKPGMPNMPGMNMPKPSMPGMPGMDMPGMPGMKMPGMSMSDKCMKMCDMKSGAMGGMNMALPGWILVVNYIIGFIFIIAILWILYRAPHHIHISKQKFNFKTPIFWSIVCDLTAAIGMAWVFLYGFGKILPIF